MYGISRCVLPQQLENILRFDFSCRKAVEESIEELLFKKFPFLQNHNGSPIFPMEIELFINFKYSFPDLPPNHKVLTPSDFNHVLCFYN